MRPARRLLATVLLALAAGLCLGQENLDAVIERAMRDFEVPGLTAAVVKDGKVLLAKGYGVRRLGDSAPVTPRTMFGIASNTKAFTAAALAMLVDGGSLRWDDPVIRHLPSFQMHDPYVTREMTVRDLLVHRSGLGLGAGDLLFWPETDLSRDEIIRRLRFVRPAASFRSRYYYDNVLYLVAGQIIPAVTGKSWDDFIQERIFDPLGMTGSAPSLRRVRPGADIATAHAPADGKLQPLPRYLSDNHAPAGSIQSCVADMVEWVAVQLNAGDMGKARLFSAAQSEEMWSAHTAMPLPKSVPGLEHLRPNFQAYGLGWVLSDYRGRKMVHHTGGLAGMVSRVTLVPDLKLGVIVLTNQERRGAYDSVTFTVIDHHMGARPVDWVSAFREAEKRGQSDAEAALRRDAAKRNPNSQPSLVSAAYAGRYRDAWYGDVTLREEGGKLVMRFTHTPELTGDLEHWQYDTFIARWRNRALFADAYVTFSLQPDGSIDEVKMAAVSPLTDFSFDFHDLLLKPVPPDAPPYD